MEPGLAVTRLQEDGFVFLPGVVPNPVHHALVGVVEHLRASGRARSRQVLYTHGPVPQDTPHLDALLDQWLSPHRIQGAGSTRTAAEALRPLAASLLGEAPVLFQDLVLVKRPGQKPFPWHQDFPYWPVDRPAGVVIWVPLVDCGARRGGLQLAQGSHLLGARPVVDLHRGSPQCDGARLGFDSADYPIVKPDFEVGDAVAFLPTTFHASPSMVVDTRRAVWVSIWLSPQCRWSHARAPNHPLCRSVQDGAPVSEQSPC